ncbi:MAG: hypothetical protein ABSG43_24370 [Solirubrobacteraceae bacterium]
MRAPQDPDRHPSREELMDEARRAAADPADRAEMRAVREDMDAVAAPWPDDINTAPDRRYREGGAGDEGTA